MKQMGVMLDPMRTGSEAKSLVGDALNPDLAPGRAKELKFGSPNATRTYDPSVNSSGYLLRGRWVRRRLSNELKLKTLIP
jgi:hypothetical protein